MARFLKKQVLMKQALALPLSLLVVTFAAACSVQVESAPAQTRAGVASTPPPADLFPTVAPVAPGYDTHCSPAPAVHTNAVCLCGSMAHAGELITEASAGDAADVGVNGDFSAATSSTIAGSLRVTGDVSMSGTLAIRDHLASGSDLSGAGTLGCGGDLAVGGDLSGAVDGEVKGKVRVRGNQSIAGGLKSGGNADFVAAKGAPCDCNPSTFYDVATAVKTAQRKNDNAAAGLDAKSQGAPTPLTLRAGRYYFEDLRTLAAIRIEGEVQLYVAGSLTQVGSGSIVLAPGAKLDLFVDGDLNSAGDFVTGDGARPDAMHLYVSRSVSFAGDRAFHGSVYAPTGTVSFAGSATIDGALTARDVSYAGTLRVRYAKPLNQGESCETGSKPTFPTK